MLLGLFLVVHGLVHLLYFVSTDDPKYPMTASKSWLVGRVGIDLDTVRLLVAALVIIATVGFILLALSHWGLLVPAGWLKALAVIAVSASLLLIAVTWNYQFVVGIAIDFGILYWALRLT